MVDMKQAEVRATNAATAFLSTMEDGHYTITIHTYTSIFVVEKGQIFGLDDKGKRYPTFMEVARLKLLTKQGSK